MMRIIEMGKKEGAIQANLSDEVVIFYIQMYINWIKTMEFKNNKKLYSEIVDLFFYGLMGDPDK